MAIANVVHAVAVGPNTCDTGAGVDTSGANLLTVALTENGVGAVTVSDNKGNTWTKRTEQNFTAPQKVIYDAKNPTVGSGHIFTMTGSSIYTVADVDAWSGADTTAPFDQENGTGGGSMASGFQPGSVTPSTDGQLVLSGLSWNDTTVVSSVTGMANLAQTDYGGGNNYGGGRAWTVQTTATAINPAWNWSGGTTAGNCVVATYKAGAGGGGGSAIVPIVDRQYRQRWN